MFSIFSRYILRAHLAPFLFGFLTVILIFLMQFLLNYLDLLVGKGLDTKVQNNLKAKFLKNDTLIEDDLKEYLNSNNIYYDIPIQTFEKIVKRS